MTPEQAIERLVESNQLQARASTALVEIQRENSNRLEEIRKDGHSHGTLLARISDTLERIERDQREGRATGVDDLKQHITAATRSRNGGKLIGWLLAAAATVIAAALTALAITRHNP